MFGSVLNTTVREIQQKFLWVRQIRNLNTVSILLKIITKFDSSDYLSVFAEQLTAVNERIRK